MNNPNAVQPCGIALTDEPQYDTFEEWLNAAIDFANLSEQQITALISALLE